MKVFLHLHCIQSALALSIFSPPGCAELSQKTILKNHTLYPQLSTGERARVEREPIGIYAAHSEQDVIKAVTCAHQTQTRIVPRSGGHSYESFSSANDALVIDLANYKSVQLVEGTQFGSRAIAAIDTGARLGNIYITLDTLGNYTFNGGTCPGVGVGGLVGGGGYGLLSRMYGLSSDQIVGMRVVLYNGTLINATSSENSDLFWALRGGNAGSFGVVTKYYANVYKVPEITMFSISYNVTAFPDLLDKWQNAFYTADSRLTSQFQFWSQKLLLFGQFSGPKEEALSFFKQSGVLDSSLGIVSIDFRDDCSMLESKQYPWTFDCDSKKVASVLHAPVYSAFKTYGKFKADYFSTAIPRKLALKISDRILNAPNKDAWIQFETLGGAISSFSDESSPYSNRKTMISAQYMVPLTKGESPQNSTNWDWIRQLEAEIKPYTNGHKYQNYPDLEIGPNYGVAYYGKENFERLKKIKAKYDPNNVFRNEQSIPLP